MKCILKHLTFALILLTINACMTTSLPKLTGKSRREPPHEGETCLKDVRSDADRKMESAMAQEFNKGFFPNIPITGLRWYCFYPDAGLRLEEQTYSRSGKAVIDDKYGARYLPSVQGFVGAYPARSDGPADESRNEIRMTRAGTLVVEYALKKDHNPGCPDIGPSIGDPDAYALQHMEICMPESQFQKLLMP